MVLSLAGVLLVAACGGESTGPDTVPAGVQVTSADTLRSFGATVALAATVTNASQQSLPGSAISSWETSNPSVVTVNTTTGLATAVADGEATVTAHAGTVTGSTKVVVRQQASATKSTLSTTRSLTFVGDAVRVTLTLRDALDNPIKSKGAAIGLTSTGGTSALTPGAVVDQGNGIYTSDFVGGAVGSARTIGATVDGSVLSIANAPTLRVVGFTKIVAQGSSIGRTCGIITTSELYCWGEADPITRGAGTLDPVGLAPTLVAGGHRWTDVDMRVDGGCGITDNAKLYCWGYGFEGAIGNGTTTGSYPLAVAVLPDSSFEAVDLGMTPSTCAITTGHTALCWSLGRWGQLGNGADTMVVAPVPVSGGHKFAGIATSSAGSCGVTNAGTAMCWGYYFSLGMGSGPYPDTCAGPVACAKTPVATSGGITFKPIIVHDGNQVCAIATNDKTYCWGIFGYQVPTELAGAPAFTSIAAGDLDACGVAQGGTAYCWGTNRNGRFGMPPNAGETHLVPEPVPGDHRFTQLSMGQNHMCGVATDGNAWCWGSNNEGELGDRTTTSSSVPVRVKLFAP
jgi:hypothetical protein